VTGSATAPNATEADVLRLAPQALRVPRERIEIQRTGGCWLARERQEETE